MIRTLAIIAFIAATSQLVPAQAVAQEGLTFKVEEFKVENDRAEIALNVSLDLNDALRDAVDGGLVVAFELEMSVVRKRWLFDQEIYGGSWTAELRRRKYGQGYEYRRFGEEDWSEANSIDDAFLGMRNFRTIHNDADMVSELRDPNVYVAHRVEVDLDALPNPIKVELLTTPGWNFSSGWQETWH